MNYLVACLVLAIIYVVGILVSKHLAAYKRIFNIIFVLAIFLSYLYVVIYMYEDVGAADWNFQNTLPTANVSPFMFCLVLVTLVMPKGIKSYVFTLVSLLSLGMLVAGLGGCISYVARQYAFHWHITMDCTAHMLISLFGVYLVKSGQVELTPKKALRSGAIIVCVAVLMLVLNLIFDTAFFGLSLTGKHNIYNNVLFDNGIVSALAYFAGLCGVLALGYFYQKAISFKRK